MNANGMISTVASAGSAAAAVSPAAGKAGSTAGFAGALVQAMGDTGSGAGTASGTAVPAGLAGLMGLFGLQITEQTSQDLLQLIAGLTEQLNALDPNTELPADVQNQMAGLLLLLQGQLTQMGVNPQNLNGDAVSAGQVQMNSDASGNTTSLASSNAQPVSQTLKQSLGQLSAMLSKGNALPVKNSLLTEQLQQTMNVLSAQLSAGQQSVAAAPGAKTVQANAQQAAADLTAEGSETMAAASAQPAAAAAPEIRQASVPLRNPVWQFQTVHGTEGAETNGTATATAVEPTEASGQNGSAPAWTFLKGDNPVLTSTASAQAPASAHVPVQQFADQMGKYLVKQFLLTQGNGIHEAKIMLHPEHLGQVDIKIMIQNGQLTAHFVTDNGAARDLLENQMSQLRAALQGQGLQVDRMEVIQQSSPSATASFFQQNQRQPGSGQNGNSRGSRTFYDDSVGFEAELDRTTYLREVGYGSSLNVKA